jgi:proline iminopeptidase
MQTSLVISSSPTHSPRCCRNTGRVFSSYDGTKLAYHVYGEGMPLVCLGGGPMQDSAYLGDLGGLSAHRQLIVLDHRGTGESEVPADPSSYRCDRLVEDVEALRLHLGVDRLDLLAHCAGVNLAVLYATRYPDHIGRLVLVTPSTFAVGITVADDDRLAVARLREGEPWFAPAWQALERIQAGEATDERWDEIEPFWHGRWDAVAQAHQAAAAGQRNPEPAAAYGAEGAYDPPATRAALARLAAPVLLIAGEVDISAPPRVVSEYAALFSGAQVITQPGAGHYPWLDDPERFTSAIAAFLD